MMFILLEQRKPDRITIIDTSDIVIVQQFNSPGI